MHLSAEQVERLLHGELSDTSGIGVREHVALCRECRLRMDDAALDERRTFTLLGELDHDVPRVDVEQLIARAQPGRPAWHRWAAGWLIAVSVAGAAYAAPGSPVPAWVRSLWRGTSAPSASPPTAPASAPAPAPGSKEALGGLAVEPGNALLIEFRTERAGSVLQVMRTSGPVVLIQGPASAASFTSAAGRVVIDNISTDSVTFELQIPRVARRVEVRVGSRQVFLQDAGTITAASDSLAHGGYTVPLAALRR